MNAWLRDRTTTQQQVTDQLNRLLEQAGLDIRVSKSAVQRHAARMETVGKKLRESRELAKMWLDKLGAVPEGEIGHLLNEIVRMLAFEVATKIGADSQPPAPKALREIATAIHRLEQASTISLRREQEIRDLVKKEAADAVKDSGRKAGVSEQTLKTIEQQVLGLS